MNKLVLIWWYTIDETSIAIPIPFEVTGDPAWDYNGAMTKKYDLKTWYMDKKRDSYDFYGGSRC